MRGGKTLMVAVIGLAICCLTLTGCFWKKKPVNNGNTGDSGSGGGNPAVSADGNNGSGNAGQTGNNGGNQGLNGGNGGNENPNGNNNGNGNAAAVDPGRLIGVHYESSAGSMEFHSEFEIDVNEQEIAYLSYYSNYYFDDLECELDEKELAAIDNTGRVNQEENSWDEDRVERKNVPLDKELWNVLVEEFEYLKPKLVEIPEFTKEDSARRDSEMQVLDGGDYSLLHLTWEKDGNTYTAQYYSLSGKRWSAIIDTLHEMARPVGREIRRIGETQITDMYLKTPDYSYQISPVSGEDKYYFFIHDGKSKDKKLTKEQWAVVRDHLSAMDLSSFKEGGYDDKLYLQLKYNDGDYKYYLVDKRTADELKEYLLSLNY
ncbi:MAG: hypothetical protein J5824_02420 [Lachnospiraceae bacterium]|nr:hypothetical protein [Lachnospiraceae bacterium]